MREQHRHTREYRTSGKTDCECESRNADPDVPSQSLAHWLPSRTLCPPLVSHPHAISGTLRVPHPPPARRGSQVRADETDETIIFFFLTFALPLIE